MNIEQWRPIPGHEGSYEVSDLGNVKSLDRITHRGRRWRGRMLSPALRADGYRSASLWREGKQRTELVHRLVLLTFVGPAPEGAEALHKDGDPGNNALANLSWDTHSRNQFDQVQHGTHPHASKSHCVAGHPFDESNTYIYPGRNKRGCRACRSRWTTRAKNLKEVA